MFISPFKDKESWESALSRFPQPRAVVSDGDKAIAFQKMRIYDLCSTSRIIYGDLIRDIMKFDVKRKYIFDNLFFEKKF
jgi:hypothetical protein